MTKKVGYEWLLRERMAERGMWKTTELAPLLAERGIELSPAQIYRLVTHTPERLSLVVLAALCDILGCGPSDLIVPHVGLTTKGMIGARTALSLGDAARKVQSMADAAKQVREDVLVLCHGGPIAEPSDVAEIYRQTRGIVGFFGASSIERLPTEPAIVAQVRSFASLRPSGP